MRLFNLNIKINTFTKKGIKSKDTPWGCYMVTGFQGSGKSYFSCFYLMEFIKRLKFNNIKTNIHSLKIPDTHIEYFTRIEQITDDTEKNCIYLIDELSKKYCKSSPQDKSFYSWLQQSRKRGRIVILITQEWKEVPMWLRRPIRFMFYTRRLGAFPIFVTTKGDALNCTYNVDTNEWECPVLEYIIYKRTKQIASLYDTYEPITDL